MRIRPIASLSVAAAAVLLLAGCTGSSNNASTPGASGSADASSCQSALSGGAVSSDVKVSGDFQGKVDVTLPDAYAPEGLQRTTLIEGTGQQVRAGDVLKASFTLVDVSSGEAQLETQTTSPAGMDTLVSSQQIFGAALECATIGSRTVSAFPAGALGEGSPAFVLVADAIEEMPTRATGAEVAPVDGFPTVTFDGKGAPVTSTNSDGKATLPVSSAPAPTETRVENLRQGDGDVVNSGDQVIVQYTGALYSDGTIFDSSWDRGTPAQFATTGVVPGFRKALEGQTVGSQVVVVMPASDAYGDAGQGDIPGGAALMFVVDILGVQHAEATAQ